VNDDGRRSPKKGARMTTPTGTLGQVEKRDASRMTIVFVNNVDMASAIAATSRGEGEIDS
jgi:hypothetical protein